MDNLSSNLEKESGLSDSDAASGQERNDGDDIIKPHEKRAINFLVNEYLLQYDYKLTSVTFAEENENQVRNGG